MRGLPKITIRNLEFYVDIRQMEFRQVDDPHNAISFRDVQDNGDHTALLFDPQTKNAFSGTQAELSQRSDVELVKLPPLLELDLDGIASELNKWALNNYRKREEQDQPDRGKKIRRGRRM